LNIENLRGLTFQDSEILAYCSKMAKGVLNGTSGTGKMALH